MGHGRRTSRRDGSPKADIAVSCWRCTRTVAVRLDVCFDADERVTGDLRALLASPRARDWDGIRVRLFDAYMTPDDTRAYHSDRELLGFRHFWPGERDILMLWQNRPEVFFAEQHAREPGGLSGCRLQTLLPALWKVAVSRPLGGDLRLLHSTFSVQTYGRKWLDRKGRAIHTQSDFMRPLYEWGDALFAMPS